MKKLLKLVIKIVLVVAAVYGGYRVTKEIKSGQLKMKFNNDGPYGTRENNVVPIKQKKKPAEKKVVLSKRQREIFNFIEKEGAVEMKDLSDKIKDVTSRTLRRDLNKLEDLGLIEREGKTKSVKYFVSK